MHYGNSGTCDEHYRLLCYKFATWPRNSARRRPIGLCNEFDDLAASAAIAPPWTEGGFDWVIPSKWQIQGSSQTNNFTQWTESFRLLSANGDFSVSKFGQTVTRSTNNVINP